ncbi:hypothetical protein HII36_46960 [Nonomuraea sp. NN258]|uniref:SAM-dependent methyltransferase n=1 Tax=Nonomuraea antri TaxID=2730852 RepID=UPI001569ACBA|nr:SAM-dependent methyltransferase [Nonomuraea antri]NRQ39315.1 hypothetical protein [Nonomuraea antri]
MNEPENRAFLRRAVEFLSSRGITQFLDLAQSDSREVVRAIDPGAGYVRADPRAPEKVFGLPEVLDVLDLTRPVAVLLVSVLHFVPDSDDPLGLVRRLVEPVPPGSHLVISHATLDFGDPGDGGFTTPRTYARIGRFFDGLGLVEPGLVKITTWRPGDETPADHARHYAGVGRKP